MPRDSAAAVRGWITRRLNEAFEREAFERRSIASVKGWETRREREAEERREREERAIEEAGGGGWGGGDYGGVYYDKGDFYDVEEPIDEAGGEYGDD